MAIFVMQCKIEHEYKIRRRDCRLGQPRPRQTWLIMARPYTNSHMSCQSRRCAMDKEIHISNCLRRSTFFNRSTVRGSSFNLVYTAYSLEFGEEFVSLLFLLYLRFPVHTRMSKNKFKKGFFYETWNVFDNVRLPLRLINKCRFVKLSYHCI